MLGVQPGPVWVRMVASGETVETTYRQAAGLVSLGRATFAKKPAPPPSKKAGAGKPVESDKAPAGAGEKENN